MESLNGYSISIIGGKKQEDGYVSMKHLQNYKIKLANHHSERCQATLKVDGIHMGNFIINSYDTIIIERPVQSQKQFKFVLTDTIQSHIGGIESGNYFNGLIEVRFIPEKQLYYRQCLHNSSNQNYSDDMESNSRLMENCSFKSRYQEGGTVLGGRSKQQFVNVHPLALDYFRETNLSVRLVGINKSIHDDISPLPYRYSIPKMYPDDMYLDDFDMYRNPYQYLEPRRIPPPPPVGKKPDPWFKRYFYSH
jgi:hypothetical protein